MANKKISELDAATALTGAETIPIVQSGATKKSTFILALENVLRQVVSNTSSVFIGKDAGKLNTGITNVAIGVNALSASSANVETVAIGYNALKANIDTGGLPAGAYNVAIGFHAMEYNTTGNHCTAVGWQALRNNSTGTSNTAVGQDALLSNTTGIGNVALGSHAGMFITEGEANVSIGTASLSKCTTGDQNVALGTSAMLECTTGSQNTAIGDRSGYVGGNYITTDTKVTLLGANTDVNRASANAPFTNATAIGYGANVYGSNQIVLGDYNVTDVYFGNERVNAETYPYAKLHFGKMKMTNIPTSADGLSSGDVWANSNILTIVP